MSIVLPTILSRHPRLRTLTTFLVVTVGSVLVCLLLAWSLRPPIRSAAPPHDVAELARLQALWSQPLDPQQPPRIHIPVGYDAGPAAPWWPRVEAPLVAELREQLRQRPDASLTAEERLLRDLGPAERIGSEPCVVRGVDGPGQHGGTLMLGGGKDPFPPAPATAPTLVRWSPLGYPLVPNVAQSFRDEHGDATSYVFTLRRGMRWSDGQPFTSNDIAWWWEHEVIDAGDVCGGVDPAWLKLDGSLPRFEVIDERSIRFAYVRPFALFLEMLARFPGVELCEQPAHYLRQYHPKLGDQELIARELAARGLPTAKELYREVLKRGNPACPRLWPWVVRQHQTTAPFTFVRNPWYWQVDEDGRQLPYLDRLLTQDVNSKLTTSAVAAGTVHFLNAKVQDYTRLLSNRFQGEGEDRRRIYECYRWFRGDRSDALIYVNINKSWETIEQEPRPVAAAVGMRLAAPIIAQGQVLALRDGVLDQAAANAAAAAGVATVAVVVRSQVDETARRKAELLRQRDFRRALSLAIDRQDIIDAIYQGEPTPAQVSPGPQSLWRHDASFQSDTAFDPAAAERLLDGLGLQRRGQWRTFADGSAMNWVLDFPEWFNPVTAQLVCAHWAAVGIYCVPRQRNSAIFYASKAILEQDFTCFTGNNEFLPALEPRAFVPTSDEANHAIGYARWYTRGGLRGDSRALQPGCIEPPAGEPARQAIELYEQLRQTPGFAAQKPLMDRILDLAAAERWTIGLCTTPDYVVAVATGLKNVPRRAVWSFDYINCSHCGMETWAWDDAARREEPPATRAAIADAIARVTEAASSRSAAKQSAGGDTGTGGWGWLVTIAAALTAVALAVRHPFIGRRLLLMVPTLFIISVISFALIQLPPGDFLSTKLAEMQASGETIDQSKLDSLRQQYGLDLHPVQRYLRWVGIEWFWHFDGAHTGLLQGDLGRSMAQDNARVNDVIGDRITLTVLVSLGTILFTWAVALPTGIYSAVRQYTVGDYVLTVFGFLGMCVPGFLLAIILMYLARVMFGVHLSGLFSEQYAGMPGWSWGKFLDLLAHIWVPVVVLGVGGTGHMIRIMRANLLDELKKPYVVTARAKGVRPLRLLVKYPVRLALNPFVSGIGGLFPTLISGATIVAIILSLPLVGPVQLTAILNQDTALAGSMLVILSALAVIGTLVSDLLLLWLDPRIRMEGAKP